jgi:hypothetical protein
MNTHRDKTTIPMPLAAFPPALVLAQIGRSTDEKEWTR